MLLSLFTSLSFLLALLSLLVVIIVAFVAEGEGEGDDDDVDSSVGICELLIKIVFLLSISVCMGGVENGVISSINGESVVGIEGIDEDDDDGRSRADIDNALVVGNVVKLISVVSFSDKGNVVCKLFCLLKLSAVLLLSFSLITFKSISFSFSSSFVCLLFCEFIVSILLKLLCVVSTMSLFVGVGALAVVDDNDGEGDNRSGDDDRGEDGREGDDFALFILDPS